MSTINVHTGQPFSARSESCPETADVLLLQFDYDAALVKLLKSHFRTMKSKVVNPELFVWGAGGWLPSEKKWFCEVEAWPSLKTYLSDIGYDISESQGAKNVVFKRLAR